MSALSRLLGLLVCLLLIACGDQQPGRSSPSPLDTLGDDDPVAMTPDQSVDGLPEDPDAADPAEPPSNPADNPDTGDQTPIDPVPPPEPEPEPEPVGSFELRLDAVRFELIEANENGVTVPIHLSRIDGHTRPVRIRIEGETEEDTRRLDIQPAQAELVGDEIFTSWRAELGVSIGPILFHERRFRVVANDGMDEQVLGFALDVRPIAVPDVYLLIGQSNMEGTSELGARDTSPGGADAINSRIRQLNVRQNNRGLFDSNERFTDEAFNVFEPRYIPAEDPLHEPRFPFRNNKEGSFIGLGLSFAKAALPNTTQEIVLVPAAWSGRGFCGNDDPPLSWNAEPSDEEALGGTLLVERALTRLNMTLRDTGGVFRGMLWHQGEADSNNRVCAERYEGNLIKLVQRLRSDANVDARGEGARGRDAPVPFVVGTMSRGNDERGTFSVFAAEKQRVDDAHRNFPNLVPFAALANGDDLVPPAFPCGQGSCIHFGAAGYRELGQRYYSALENVVNAHP